MRSDPSTQLARRAATDTDLDGSADLAIGEASSLVPRGSPLLVRINQAVAGQSEQRLGASTGTHPELVRAYLSGRVAIPAEWVLAICEVYDISAHWLLFGDSAARSFQDRIARDTPEHPGSPCQALEMLIAAIEQRRREAQERARPSKPVTGRPPDQP